MRGMEIRDSARRHGIADPDVHHAIGNAVAAGPVETNVDQIDGGLYICPDRTGRMLEVITVEDIDDGDVAIRAMELRKAYERYLQREDRPRTGRRSDVQASRSPTSLRNASSMTLQRGIRPDRPICAQLDGAAHV
jgi:hypothetical protein